MQSMFMKVSATVVLVAILALVGLTGTPQVQASEPAQATGTAVAAPSSATEAAVAATPADEGAFPPCPDMIPQPTPEATSQAAGAATEPAAAAASVATAAAGAATPDLSAMKVGPFQTTQGCTLQAKMSGGNEVPKQGPAKAHGEAVLVVIRPDTGPGTICFTIDGVGGVTLPMTAAHIHSGAAGVAGPVIVPLAAPDANSRGLATGCTTGVDRALIKAILTEPYNYYVNLHNAEYPGGVMRGQLQPPPQ